MAEDEYKGSYDWVIDNLQNFTDNGVPQETINAWLEKPFADGGAGVQPNAVGWGTMLSQGATLGSSDEMEAALQKLTTGRDYDRSLAVLRFGMEQYRSKHPWKSMGLEAAGAIIPTVGSMMLSPVTVGTSAVPAATNTARLVNTALNLFKPSKTFWPNVGKSAALGGAYGYGVGEGGPEERARMAIPSAGIAGPVGGLSHLAGRLLSPLYRSSVQPPPETGGRLLGDEAILRALKADDIFPSEVASEVAQRQRGLDPRVVGVNPGPVVPGALSGRIVAGQSNPNAPLRESLNEVPTKPFVAADLGDQTRGLLEAAHLIPGQGQRKTKQFLLERDLGPSVLRRRQVSADTGSTIGRLTDDLKLAFGDNARFFPEFKKLEASRLSQGRALYEKADPVMIEVTPNLLKILNTKFGRDAFSKARINASNKRVELPKVVINNQGKLVDSKGNVITAVQTKFLHWIKKAMDDELELGGTYGSSKKQGSHAQGITMELLDDLLDIMDSGNPAYTAARNAWAGDSQMLNAMVAGQKFLNANPEELAEIVGRYTTGELEAFRVGAMGGLLDDIESKIASGNVVTNLLHLAPHQRRLRLAFPEGEAGDKPFNEFLNRLTVELDMKITKSQVLGGSQTAARQQLMKFLNDSIEQGVSKFDAIHGMVTSSFRQHQLDVGQDKLEKASLRIAEIMTETNPVRLGRYMEQLGTNEGSRELIRTALGEAAPKSLKAAFAPAPVGVASGLLTDRAKLDESAVTKGIAGLLGVGPGL